MTWRFVLNRRGERLGLTRRSKRTWELPIPCAGYRQGPKHPGQPPAQCSVCSQWLSWNRAATNWSSVSEYIWLIH